MIRRPSCQRPGTPPSSPLSSGSDHSPPRARHFSRGVHHLVVVGGIRLIRPGAVELLFGLGDVIHVQTINPYIVLSAFVAMWGTMASCRPIVNRPPCRLRFVARRPINNRPQDAILPYISPLTQRVSANPRSAGTADFPPAAEWPLAP